MPDVREPTIERLASADGAIAPTLLGVRGSHPVLAIGGTTQPLDADTAVGVVEFLEVAVDVAARHDAVIVTGATDAGVFHLLGRVLAHASSRPAAVIGVAPADLVAAPGDVDTDGRVPLEPHHTAFLLVPGGTWGCETPALSRLVDLVAGDRPAVALLVGGGEGARAELDEHRRRGRPIVVLGGSGRLADELAADLSIEVTDNHGRRGGGVTVVEVDEGPERLRALLDDALGETAPRTMRERIAMLTVWPRLRFRATAAVAAAGRRRHAADTRRSRRASTTHSGSSIRPSPHVISERAASRTGTGGSSCSRSSAGCSQRCSARCRPGCTRRRGRVSSS